MKKIFIAVSLVAMMAACTGNSNSNTSDAEAVIETLDEAQNDSLSQIVEQVTKAGDNITPAVKEAIENDTELKGLVEKAENGELTQEEKLTLWQKLKKIGGEVVLGTKSATDGATEAVNEVQNAGKEEITDAAQKAIDAAKSTKSAQDVVKAAEDVKKTADDVKKKADDTKQKIQNVKNAIDAFKK